MLLLLLLLLRLWEKARLGFMPEEEEKGEGEEDEGKWVWLLRIITRVFKQDYLGK